MTLRRILNLSEHQCLLQSEVIPFSQSRSWDDKRPLDIKYWVWCETFGGAPRLPTLNLPRVARGQWHNEKALRTKQWGSVLECPEKSSKKIENHTGACFQRQRKIWLSRPENAAIKEWKYFPYQGICMSTADRGREQPTQGRQALPTVWLEDPQAGMERAPVHQVGKRRLSKASVLQPGKWDCPVWVQSGSFFLFFFK